MSPYPDSRGYAHDSRGYAHDSRGYAPRFPWLRTPIPGVTHPDSRGCASLHPGLRMGRLPGASPDFRGYAHDSRGCAPRFPGLRFAPPRVTYGAPSRRLTRFSWLRPRFPGLRTPIPGVTLRSTPGYAWGAFQAHHPIFVVTHPDSRGYAPRFPGLRFAPPRATYGAPSRRLTRFPWLRPRFPGLRTPIPVVTLRST